MELYYYTTTETMKYILSDGNIFATNMKYMNDSEEYLNGLKEVRDYILNSECEFKSSAEKKLTKELYHNHIENEVNSFSISFTTARDLLSQWSMYAKESGVSLKMEFKEEDYTFQAFNSEGKKRDNYCMHPQKVYYFTREVMSQEKYQEMGNEIVQKMKEQFQQKGMKDYDDNIEQLWLSIAPFVKRADFGAEEEYRLVFDFNNVTSFTPRVDFRNDKNVLKPYLDISLKNGWPITEIIVGPGFNQDAVFKSISYYLNKGKVLVPPISMEEMSGRMKEYFQGMEKGDMSTQEVKALLDEWDKTYGNFVKYNKASDKDVTNRLYEEFASFIKNKGKNTMFQEYIRNNFFALSGITLRKSKIPYIY